MNYLFNSVISVADIQKIFYLSVVLIHLHELEVLHFLYNWTHLWLAKTIVCFSHQQNLLPIACLNLILQLLPILDNFDRTLKAIEGTDNLTAIKEGIK